MKPWGNQVHAMTIFFFLALLLADMPSPPTDAATIRAVWLADLHPGRLQPGPGRFVFVPGSRADDVTGHWCVEAAGAGDVLRVVSFAKGETDEGLDISQPVVVEGVLAVIRHPARGEFRAVVELQVREARLVAFCQQSLTTAPRSEEAARDHEGIGTAHVSEIVYLHTQKHLNRSSLCLPV